MATAKPSLHLCPSRKESPPCTAYLRAPNSYMAILRTRRTSVLTSRPFSVVAVAMWCHWGRCVLTVHLSVPAVGLHGETLRDEVRQPASVSVLCSRSRNTAPFISFILTLPPSSPPPSPPRKSQGGCLHSDNPRSPTFSFTTVVLLQAHLTTYPGNV